ncbi:nucleotide-binding alpha-beta plait domain-containing protein [Tanacetum coccineum]|uniref:Nucleotide-binding alpha-beta plait domain-containing protein n=1 Tax=Tanacetum coccineum TaxID=301880 RepID=A0ABQ5H3H3_9ASTR
MMATGLRFLGIGKDTTRRRKMWGESLLQPTIKDSGALWKMFSRYGSVVDVYIAFKRTKKGMRFNFMRFKNIIDIMALERRLKGILISDFKLIINHAKVIKLGGVKAVVGPSSKSQPSVLNVPVEEDSYLRRRLEKCWVGKAKNIQVLQNAWDIMKNNGLVDCQEENSDPSGRLIWLNIEGLPILARNIGVVKSVAKNFGQNLEIGRLDFNSRSLLPVTEDQFHASIFLPSGSDHPKHDDELSSFEEEFVIPIMVDSGDEDGGANHQNGAYSWDDEKLASFLSSRKSYRVVDAENFENDCNNDKSSFNPSPLSSTRLPPPYELYPA